VFALLAPDGRAGTHAAAISARGRKHHVRNPAFAGYLTNRGGLTEIVGRLRVPGVACNQKERAISPGGFLLAGPSDRGSFSAANVIVGCYRGVPTAQEAMVVNGVEFDYTRPIQRGDVIVFRLTDSPGKQTVVQLRNLTSPRKFVITRRGRGVAPNAELVGDWGSIDAQTAAQLPPPDFEPTTFRSVTVDGRALGAGALQGYDMASARGILQIKTGPLRGQARNKFTCRRKSPRGLGTTERRPSPWRV
jgi:hypothetical protein